MSKRKAGVNDIIYELDNDDVEISSDDEPKESKINRIDTHNSENHIINSLVNEENEVDTIKIDCSSEDIDINTISLKPQNGGKMSPVNVYEGGKNVINNGDSLKNVNNEVDSSKKLGTDGSKTTIFNEDIVIDSPASNSDLGVVGCENRTPLVTIRFRDNKLAKSYKQHLKTFMLNLIKLHDEENVVGSETETDLELDIWPEDLIDEEFEYEKKKPEDEKKKEPEDGLFFVDTAPCDDVHYDIPKYEQVSTLISNVPETESSPPQVSRRGPICFNCDGSHALRDCPAPKNKARIAENRKSMASTRVGRYHVEDEQKYGHLIGGRISGQLRHALGLKRHELPLHIYKMRVLGYPPGWLEEARISHSGITLFDSTGTAILDPEEEEGEVCEPGSKDKFDIKKILDFPGFNVPASSRYKEEAHIFNLPPMSDQDSKMSMLQKLAPNAVKAYKRKKLTFFPSASLNNSLQEGQAEMDLDSGDETAEFPSVPPLPDEAPPPVPMPPPSPPPLPPLPPPDDDVIILDESQEEKTESSANETSDSIEIIDVVNTDVPLATEPELVRPVSSQEIIDVVSQTDDENNSAAKEVNVDVINIDIVDDDVPLPGDDTKMVKDNENMNCERSSPSLDDLEIKKKILLQALEGSQDLSDLITLDDTENEEINITLNSTSSNSKIDVEEITESGNALEEQAESSPSKVESNENQDSKTDDPELAKTPDSKAGQIKTTAYGTPVVNVASSYLKLPTDDKFAKDICDVINFENLPNSTGKYKQISNLLKKVKNEVDRIQES